MVRSMRPISKSPPNSDLHLPAPLASGTRQVARTAAKHATAIPLSAQLRLAKLEAALTDTWNSAILGSSVIGAAAYWLTAQTLFGSGAGLWWLFGAALFYVYRVMSVYDDPATEGRMLRELMAAHLGLDRLRDKAVHRQVAMAIDYRVKLAALESVQSENSGELVRETLPRIDRWVWRLGELARRVDAFQADAGAQATLAFELRQRIGELEERAGATPDQRLVAQLRETIAGRRHQLRMAEELDSLTERGGLRLEQAVAALGTIAAQLAMVASRGVDLSETPDINGDIGEEITQIDFLLAAFDRTEDLQPHAHAPSKSR